MGVLRKGAPAGVGLCVICAGGKKKYSMDEQAKLAKKKFYKRWWFWVLVVIALFIIGAAGNGSKKNTVSHQETKTENTPSHTFDVPSLMGKNIDEVKAVLGAPVSDTEPTAQQLGLGLNEWEKNFKKDGQELLVTYRPKDRTVIDFFITANDPSGKDGLTKDTKKLLQIGNLNENDPRYAIEFVRALKDKSSYTGVKISPK